MRLFVVEARNFDIKTSLFLLLEASSPEDARKRAQAYYQQEGWAPAAIFEVQRVEHPRHGVRLLYRQRWDALQIGTQEVEHTPAHFVVGQETSPVPVVCEEAQKALLIAPVETDLQTGARASGVDAESHPSPEDLLEA